MMIFSPINQEKYYLHKDRCFTGKAPTLLQLRISYGEKAPVAWLVPQLLALSEDCGCKEKLTTDQLRRTAVVISRMYPHLKVTELMVFFFQFTGGKYGHFYGFVDPMVITDALSNKFIPERSLILDRIESEEKTRRQQERDEKTKKDSITYEEYKSYKFE